MNSGSEQLDKFINEMLASEQFSEPLNEDVFKQMHDDLKESLLDQIDRSVLEAMSEEYIDEMNELLDRNPEASDEEVQAIVVKSGVDTASVAAKTMMLFRDLYLGDLDVEVKV